MGEVLGLGLTHFPPLGWPDDTMDRALQFGFADPSVPDAVKAGRGLARGHARGVRPRPPRGGGGAPGRAGGGLRRGARRARRVRARRRGDLGRRPVRAVPRGRRARVLRRSRRTTLGFSPWRNSSGAAVPNVWDEDRRHAVRAAAATPSSAVTSRRRCSTTTSTSRTRTRRARTGRSRTRSRTRCCSSTTTGVGFPYAVVPMTVNCYGRLAVSRRGGMARFDADGGSAAALDPPSPTPRRCIDRRSCRRPGRGGVGPPGRARRVVELVARLPPRPWLADVPGPRRRPRVLRRAGRSGSTRPGTPRRSSVDRAVRAAGDAELVLPRRRGRGGGARARSGASYVETHVFNSNKCFAVFR